MAELARLVVEVDKKFLDDFSEKVNRMGSNKRFIISNLMKRWMETVDGRGAIYETIRDTVGNKSAKRTS